MYNYKIKTLDGLKKIREALRQLGISIVWTNGCFDIIHLGHIQSLYDAKSKGDTLIVGINSDISVKSLKGEGRPLVPDVERAAIIASLECVDFVIIFEEQTVQRMLKELTPDVFVKGEDYKNSLDTGEREAVEGYGGKIEFIPYTKGHSTTNIINKITNG